MNYGKPTHIKGTYNETDDLMAKDFYWLCYERFKTFDEMKIWHHAFMEMHLNRKIDEQEAEEWFLRGLNYFDMQVSKDIQFSKGRRSEIKLKSLEREGKTIQLEGKDEALIERARMMHTIKNAIVDAVKIKRNEREPCEIFRQIEITIQGQDYRMKIPL